MRIVVLIVVCFFLAIPLFPGRTQAEVDGNPPIEVIQGGCTDWPPSTGQRWHAVVVDETEVLDTAELIEEAEDLTFQQVVALVDQPGCYAVIYVEDDFPPGNQNHR